MSDPAGAVPGPGTPELCDLDAPDVVAMSPGLNGPTMTPQQYIYFYSPDEWELFIREWATGLATSYVQIKRLGGSGDRGVDVAGFKTDRGLEGSWDCYQGKHYAKALTWADAFPEMLKVFVAVVGGHYVLPDRYAFFAPQGCGPTLNRLLSKPSDLRDKFLKELSRADAPAASHDTELLGKVRTLAAATDFTMFQSVEILDALETHRSTPYFAARFGSPLPPRPGHSGPDEAIGAHETRYVEQLIEVYSEKEPTETFTADTVSAHAGFGVHFQRQRESFYSAEALRLYARDSVPPGTFEALQADVLSGVVEVAEASHQTGMDRLASVLQSSTQLQLDGHALISVSRMDDRKGICHQLANEDRVTWVREKS